MDVGHANPLLVRRAQVREDVLDTNVSRRRHAAAIVYRSPLFDEDWSDLRKGYRYTCPRCGWKSRTLKARYGAEHWADRHALDCKPRSAREDELATSESRQ